jgi:hypothetical protein
MLDAATATPRKFAAKGIEWTLSPLRNKEYGAILGYMKDQRFKSLKNNGVATHEALTESEKLTFQDLAEKLEKSNDPEFILFYVFTAIKPNHPSYTLESFNELFDFSDPDLIMLYNAAITISHPKQIEAAKKNEHEKKSQ